MAYNHIWDGVLSKEPHRHRNYNDCAVSKLSRNYIHSYNGKDTYVNPQCKIVDYIHHLKILILQILLFGTYSNFDNKMLESIKSFSSNKK